jgi:phosphatidylglycerophosphate synthase
MFAIVSCITISRLVLAIIALILGLKLDVEPSWICLVVILAMVTDIIDGPLARKYGVTTNLGVVLECIADISLTGTTIILALLHVNLTMIVIAALLIFLNVVAYFYCMYLTKGKIEESMRKVFAIGPTYCILIWLIWHA